MNLFQLSMHLLLEADTYRHRKKNLSSKAILMMNLTALLTIAFVVQLSAKDYGQLAILQEKHANFEKTNLFSSPTSVSANELLAYEIIGKTIVIKQKTEIVKPRVAETPIAAELPPPSFPVKGKITDENGNPLVKASVIIKSTNIGTTTNENGEFNLDVKDESAILVISYVGYENKEVSVKGKRTVNIILKQIVAEQQEVVVVGYGSQKKINLTGAIGSVSGESLEDRPIPNIGRGLQGELSGLNITSSDGQPGRSTTFNIRGYTSINGGSPLILVDGVPTDINNINPNDVASATVLKDAASAAVYGSRAPFGVLLITTKSGGKGIPKVGYSMNISSHKNSNLPDVVTDPATVMDFKNQAYAAYYGVNLYTSQQVDYAKQRSANPSLPITIVNPNNATLYDYYGSTNWFDELYRSSNISQIHNVNVSGGNDRVTYYFSGGYNEQTGIYRYNPDYYDRYNLRAKLSFQVTKWLEIHTNSVYNRTKYNYPSLWTSDWTSGDIYHQIGRLSSLTVPTNPDGSWTSSGAYIGFLQNGGRGTTITNETQNTLGFTASFLKNTWRIKGDYSFRSTVNNNQQYRVALPYEKGPNQLVYYAGHSDASAWSDNNAYQAIDIYSEYEKNFGKNHYFKAMVGYNQQLNNYNYFSAQNNTLISSSVGYLDATTGTTPSVGGNGYDWAIRGVFSRINYSFRNKYLLEIDARYDGSSRFPPDKHYGFFPSVSAGWKISSEPFFSGLLNIVSNFKIRASYGSLGNDQSLGNYSFVPTLTTGKVSNILGGLQPLAVYPANLVSPNLTWEKVYSKNIGVDFALFKNFNGTFDWYQRDTKGMITKGFQLPAVLGATQPLENAADLRTKGWELNLTYHNQFSLAGKPFDFNITANLWDNQTIITKYNNPNKYWFGGDYYVGQHIGDIWGLTTKGIFQTENDAKNAPSQTKVIGYYGQHAGEIQYVDLNNDGKIDYGDGTVANPGDAHIIGNSAARYNFGVGANFTWNNFDFNIFFQGIGKKDFWPGTSGYYWSMFFSPWDNIYKNMMGTTWTTDNPNAFYPSLKGWRAGDAGAWKDLAVPQTRYLYSSAYIRLKNLSIGYSLPFTSLKKIGIERLRVYVSGEDLWEYDKLPQGFDPEGLGGSFGAGKIYPFQRSYSFGFDVKF